MILLNADTALRIFPNTFLEEVRLSLERNHFHPFKWIRCLVMTRASQGYQQAVGTELNVLLHQSRVHADQLDGKSISNEFLLNVHGMCDNLHNAVNGKFVLQLAVQEASKVTVQSFITRDKFVRKGQSWHQATLLEPKDGAKTSRKEDALYHTESNASLGKAGNVRVAPLQGPIGLASDTWDRVNGMQESHLLLRVFDVGVDQERVSFRVNVLDGNLKSIKASSLRGLDLRHKVLSQVLVDNAIRGCEECKDVTNEVAFIVRELYPISHIRAQINLL
mmetsp:Transcript_8733/g.13966  ORF Transcript_8733/g.13966 Transcript_8733/m.13966 type:complete len:277 (-) Transcript_8733:444-1274(-)